MKFGPLSPFWVNSAILMHIITLTKHMATSSSGAAPQGDGAPAECYGVVLPAGMTAALALKLEEMVVRYVDAVGDSIDDAEPEWPFEFGIRVFQEIVKTRASLPVPRTPLGRC